MKLESLKHIPHPSKAFADHQEHFIQRVWERYQKIVLPDDYSHLCQSFQGVYKKTSCKTVGYVIIRETKVWCLYMNEMKVLSTAYPADIEEDIKSLVRCCFPVALRSFAIMIYMKYQVEKERVRKTFESDKEMALFYRAETLFPALHIRSYKGLPISPFYIMHQIKGILNYKSPHAELRLVKPTQP